MAMLVILIGLLSLTSASPAGYLLPPGVVYLQGQEKVDQYISPAHSHVPKVVTLPVPISRVAVPEDHELKSYTVEEAVGYAPETVSKDQVQGISNKYKTVTLFAPQPLVPRQHQFVNGSPISYLYPQLNAYAGNGKELAKHRVTRQVLGSPVWDRKVVDWGSKNCLPLPLIGGAVAGASGGPVGVLLGVVGAGIGACNFN